MRCCVAGVGKQETGTEPAVQDRADKDCSI